MSHEDQKLSRAILRYLAEHPRAMDTFDGIAQWWVMRDQVRTDVEAVARVLRRLTRQGVLEELGSDPPRYRLAHQPQRRSP